MSDFHTPVLLQKVLEFLRVQKGKMYLDATIGGGGHGFEILRRGGIVLGIDCDQEAIDYVSGRWKIESTRLPASPARSEASRGKPARQGKWKINEENLTLVRGNFRDLDRIARLHGFEKVSGVLFDLGVSSHQLETAERGFSFQKEGLLDMKMDPSTSSGQVTAADLINGLTKGELDELFTKLGEEHFVSPISESIVRARKVRPIKTTRELAEIVNRVFKRKHFKIHPATRVFMALRIAVNDELNALKEALPKALMLLEAKGRIGVISFHSLEDRIVKNSFLNFEKERLGKVLTKKPIYPDEGEILQNKRSRGAKLRVFSARG